MLPVFAALRQTKLLFYSVCRNVKDESFAYTDTNRRIITSVNR
jgi:hypothetical protein